MILYLISILVIENYNMPKYKSHFKEEWKETYPCITNFKEDTTRAFCGLCNSDFSVATTGEIQVKDHAGRDKHI